MTVGKELSNCKFCCPTNGEHELGCTDHPANAPGFIGPSYEELKSALLKVEGQRDRLRWAAKLSRNVILIDTDKLQGRWIAVPEEDFDALRKAIQESEG